MSKSVRIFWRIFFIGIGAFILLLLLINFGLFGRMPSLSQLENPAITLATEVYADDGTLMGKYYRERGNRSNVDYRDISVHAINALVATEDERFYRHSGIDGKSLVRAVAMMGRDGGASTITQQLAKNMLDQGSKILIARVIEKMKEWIIAVRLERNFTKEEILALYLNTVPFGDNIYGIRNASRTFFQKEPDQLKLEEAAVLIGMLKGNTLYNPKRNPKAAMDRRNTVIDQMVRNRFVDAAAATTIKAQPIRINYKKLDENNGLAPYFRDVIREDLKKWCKEHTNQDGDPYDLYADGLKIYTTINPRMQLYAEEAVASKLPQLQKALNQQNNIRKGTVWKGHENVLESQMKNSDRWRNMKEDGFTDDEIRASFKQKVQMKVFAWNEKREKDTVMTPLDSIKYHRLMLQIAFMVMDPISGHVKAWVGGIDFKNYKFDHVNLNTKRQVGSSIKPFLYAEAVEEGGFTPQTPVENVAQFFPGSGMVPAKGVCKGNGETVSMASALTYSLNCATAYIMKQMGPQRFTEFLKQINIPTEVKPYPSIALGACDLSLFEMLWGYTMFPAGGFSTKPIYITRIEDKNGNIIARFDSERKEVINEVTAYTMAKMMQGPVDFGTAAGLRSRLGVAEMGGKTGTTNDNADAWFFGFTPQLLAGVWVGCDDRFIRLESGLGYGGQAARPVWEYFFKKTFADNTLGLDKQSMFIQPESMKQDLNMDYGGLIDLVPPPGAEGEDVGNGRADQYFLTDTNTPKVPVDSRLTEDEKDVKKEAVNPKNSKETSPDSTDDKKKKKGFFKRLFGKKDKE
ncbi:MAG TPA: transglycosylase domain-containing protein [Chitinophagaceae bacterium]|nr:transglycosylase domain-containing protein [Chitinophagaceae bacterium]